MTDAELRARAETLWTVVFAQDATGRALLQTTDETTQNLMRMCFVNGYIVGMHSKTREDA